MHNRAIPAHYYNKNHGWNEMSQNGEVQESFILGMSTEAFRARVNAYALAVVPIGSVELEGPHLPLGVDTIVAEGISKIIARESGVLIGPVIPVGYSKWFEPFPGTISIENETLCRFIGDYCRSLIRHGIRRILFLNAHRGNNAAIEIVSHRLIAEHQVRVGMVNLWKLAADLINGKNIISEGKFTHAGELMTSMVLAIHPEVVVSEKIHAGKVKQMKDSRFEVKNSVGETNCDGSIQTIYQDIRDVTETGVLGDPTPASAEKGRMMIEMITTYLKGFLQEFRKLPLPIGS
jgi:creatinine amidohydrolase